MSKKRGLGRGIGALIPSASADERSSPLSTPTPARRSAPAATPDSAPSPASAQSAPAAVSASGSEQSPVNSPQSPSPRPVDMFFSGEPANSGTGEAKKRSFDVAADMARDAQTRRAASRRSKAVAEPSGAGLAQRSDAGPDGRDDGVTVSDRAELQKPRPVGADPSAPEDSGDDASAQAAEVNADTSDEPAATASELVAVPGAEFAELPINEIRENPRNPRTVFDEDALDELAFSLREVGVLQPVVVRPITATETGESFELVMGERRWRAAQRAGLTSIPAIIRDTSDDHLLRDALLENLHRSQLNPLEEAAAYAQLLEDFGSTQEELAERIGRSRPQITNTLRLLKLSPLVQRRVASGAISAGHARALLSLDDSRLQEELASRIVAEGLSVRAVERLISTGSGSTQSTSAPRRTTYNPKVVNLTSKISNRLEAPVRIDVGKRKGKITLEFSNLEDLSRLAGLLGIEDPELDTAE